VRAHRFPSSVEYDRRMSFACMPPAACIHWATSVPFESRSTDGRSSPLIDQLSPDATVRGCVHPSRVRSAKRSVLFESACSTQLRRTPRLETVSCGSPVLAPAGAVIAAIVGVHADRSCALNGTPAQKCDANSMLATAAPPRLPAIILPPIFMCSAPLVG
jgi:hypothetical protein